MLRQVSGCCCASIFRHKAVDTFPRLVVFQGSSFCHTGVSTRKQKNSVILKLFLLKHLLHCVAPHFAFSSQVNSLLFSNTKFAVDRCFYVCHRSARAQHHRRTKPLRELQGARFGRLSPVQLPSSAGIPRISSAYPLNQRQK